MDQDGYLSSSRHFDPNIDTLLTKVYKSWWKFFFWVLTICIGSFFIGFTNRLLMINEDKKTLDIRMALLNYGSYSVFAFVGTLSCYVFIRKVSQRLTLCIACCIGIVGCVVLYTTAFADENSGTFLALEIVAKFFQGFAAGIFSVYCPCIIKDIVPIEESVTFGSFHQLSIVFGLFVSKIFSLIISKHETNNNLSVKNIPTLFPIPLLLLMIALIKFHYKTQTAKYLIQNQKNQEAKHLIDNLYRESVANQIYLDIEHSVHAMDNSYFEGEYDMKLVKKRIIIIGIGVAIIQQISGVSIVNIYGLYPHNQEPDNSQKAIEFGIIWCGVQMGMVFVLIALNVFRNYCNEREMKCMRVISKRRNLFRIGIALTFFIQIAILIVQIALIVENNEQNNTYFQIMMWILIFFGMEYGITLGPMTWIYLSEISDIFEMTSALLASWLFSFITVGILPHIQAINISTNYNLSSGLVILICLNGISYVLVHKYLVETKYKSDIEIYRELSALNFEDCYRANNDEEQGLNR